MANQKTNAVARSSAEAEYRAMAHTVSEMMWLKQLLIEVRLQIFHQVIL